jgi:hypothetical protein
MLQGQSCRSSTAALTIGNSSHGRDIVRSQSMGAFAGNQNRTAALISKRDTERGGGRPTDQSLQNLPQP